MDLLVSRHSSHPVIKNEHRAYVLLPRRDDIFHLPDLVEEGKRLLASKTKLWSNICILINNGEDCMQLDSLSCWNFWLTSAFFWKSQSQWSLGTRSQYNIKTWRHFSSNVWLKIISRKKTHWRSSKNLRDSLDSTHPQILEVNQ